MLKPKPRTFKSRAQWRRWLDENHGAKSEIWLRYYKKKSKKASVSYDEAVEEALCFGWIDSKVISIDKDSYMQRYTPRKPDSLWSLINKKRAQKMIAEKKMTKAGLALIEEGKKRGTWQKAYTSRSRPAVPAELKKALERNKTALKHFRMFTNSQKTMYIYWTLDAKRAETRLRRIKEVVRRSEKNIKPGI